MARWATSHIFFRQANHLSRSATMISRPDNHAPAGNGQLICPRPFFAAGGISPRATPAYPFAAARPGPHVAVHNDSPDTQPPHPPEHNAAQADAQPSPVILMTSTAPG